jgi:CelD/BcsL family acetyltransferase involved in cellulose biosynthesis
MAHRDELSTSVRASLSGLDGGTSILTNAEECVYYSSAWLSLIAGLYQCTVIPLVAKTADGRLSGFLPLCLLDSPIRGRRLVGLPFSDHCPLIAADESSAQQVIEQAIQLVKERRARYLELRTGANTLLESRPDVVAADLYVRWLLPLAHEPDEVWSELRKPVQRQVNKAKKLGVHVRFAQSRKDVERFYEMHLRTRSKKHGMPTQPRAFFTALWDAFAPSGALQLLLAEYEGATVAGMILLASGSTVRYAYGASDASHLDLAPNNLLLWSAITWACLHGYKTLDLGRTARDNQGLMEFKRRWAAPVLLLSACGRFSGYSREQ